MNKEKPSRRRFIRRLVGLAAVGGIGAFLHERLAGKMLMPPVHGASMVIDAVNYGSGTTKLRSSGTDAAFVGTSTATSGDTEGVLGEVYSPDGEGVQGTNFATTGIAQGVYGESSSTGGIAVCGRAHATTGGTIGVLGEVYSPGGQGVQGWSDSKSGGCGVFGGGYTGVSGIGDTIGVEGLCGSTSGKGVQGVATANSGETYGVWGQADSTSGIGVRGWAIALNGLAEGVCGKSNSFSGTGVHGHATSTTGPAWGVWGRSDSTSGVGIMGQAGSAGATPIVAQGTTGQSADLQQWQNSAGAALARISKDGRLGIGTAPSFALHIVSGVTGPLTAASAPGAGPRPNSFICENLTPGNFKSQFTFRASGANKWSFGNDMNGNGGQNFFIWDEVAAATRLYIDSAGKVGLGTTSPTEKLHVVGNVKAASFITGDITFANGARVTEQDDGFAFVNPQGRRIAVLDSEGNLRIKGKFIEET